MGSHHARALDSTCLKSSATDCATALTPQTGGECATALRCDTLFQIPDPYTTCAPRPRTQDARWPVRRAEAQHTRPTSGHTRPARPGQADSSPAPHPRPPGLVLYECSRPSGPAALRRASPPIPPAEQPGSIIARCENIIPRHGRTPGKPDSAEVEGLPRRNGLNRRGSTP